MAAEGATIESAEAGSIPLMLTPTPSPRNVDVRTPPPRTQTEQEDVPLGMSQ